MAVTLVVRLTPRGGRDAAEGWALDADGRLIAFLAKTLKIPRSAVRLAAGETARLKRLELEGVDPADVARAFGPPN